LCAIINVIMKITEYILIFSLITVVQAIHSQFQYDEYGELKTFSYLNHKVIDQIKDNKIRTIYLPAYNNDSLFWENNINLIVNEQKENTGLITRASGFYIDTTIHFFYSASRIKIKEGFVWLYKITSPTAHELGVELKNCNLSENQYLSAHSNFHDSLNGPYNYHLPEVILGPTNYELSDQSDSIVEDRFYFNLLGNNLYIEFFSPTKSMFIPDIVITKLNYSYNSYYKRYRLSDAPEWIRKKYPEVDFNK
jgi:hypothetical protein